MGRTGLMPSSGFTTKLAGYWAEFVNCEQRLQPEMPWLQRVLAPYAGGVVFDAALGTGCESIFLLQEGFKVLSNEFDDDLRHIAQEKAVEKGVRLTVTTYDWKDLLSVMALATIDVVIVLGNSLCLLETIDDISQCLDSFQGLLKPGGLLIVDERNFPYILENRDTILDGNFRYSGKYVYCGTSVTGCPIEIREDVVKFGYFHVKDGCVGTLKMYPFKGGELMQLLFASGFKQVKKYSDFKLGEHPDADFFTYCAVKG